MSVKNLVYSMCNRHEGSQKQITICNEMDIKLYVIELF